MEQKAEKKFTLCILGDAQSIHVQRICRFFIQKNVHIHLITFRPENIEGVTVHYFPVHSIKPEGGNISILRHLFSIRKLVRKLRPDAVYAIYATSYGFMGAFANVKPFVVHALGSDILVSPRRHFLYRWILRYVFKKAKVIFSFSDFITKTIIQMHVSTEKVKLAVLGIDSSQFYLRKDIPKQPFSIISTRNFEEIYRVHALIPAIALLKERYPTLKVFIAGKGTQENKIRELVKQYQLENQVSFLGHLSPEQLAKHLSETLVYVSLSASDGTSVSLLEAMACGCIPVVTNIPANSPWIQHEQNGFLVSSLEAQEIATCIEKAFFLPTEKLQKIQQMNYELVKTKGEFLSNMENVYQIIFENKTL